ncbi:MAG: AAA family ATPase [Sulfolobales archaeon]
MICEKDLGRHRAILVAGMPGSGKGLFTEVAESCGLSVFIMGDVVREEVIRRGLEINYETSGLISAKLREELGSEAIAVLTHKKICLSKDLSNYIVIEGVRSIEEVNYFKRIFEKIYLVAIHSSPNTRFRRIRLRGREDDPKAWEDFVARDLRELSFGLGSVIALADYILINEEIDAETFKRSVISLLEKILGYPCKNS